MAKAGLTAGARKLGVGGIALIAAGLIACVAIGIAAWRSRPPAPVTAPAANDVGTVPDMIGQLERKLKGDTSDAEGWRMLGWSYFETGRYADSARAYRQAATIDPGKAQYWSALGEATVLANKSGVTPDADAAFRRALAIDPKDPRARYFVGVRKDMSGDHAGAVDDWIALLKDSPSGAPWEPDVRRLIAQVAGANHIDLSGRLPAGPVAIGPPPPGDPGARSATDVATAAIPGPSRAQMESASQLPPSAQDAMVQSMVERLAARLKSDPRDADGWIRLMRARMVLNDAAGARGALDTARATFAGDRAALGRLDEAARALGVPGA